MKVAAMQPDFLENGARLWPCNVCRPTRELADEILRRVGRSLTLEERAESGLSTLSETRPRRPR